MEINWIENVRSTVTCNHEVRITNITSCGRKYTNIAFYKNSHHKVTDGTMMKVGIASGRMYFDNAPSKGFKSSKGSTYMYYIRIPGWKEEFVGEYDLIFDAESKVWFIATNKKSKGE